MLKRIEGFALTLAALTSLAACSTSPAPAATASGSGSATAPASQAAASPGGSTAAPAAGQAKYYDCTSLLSEAEGQQATGLATFKFLKEEKGTGAPGQTYCQYFAGAVSVALSVDTGPAYTKLFQPLLAATGAATPVPGLGDQAGWSEKNASLGVRVGSTGFTIFIRDLGAGTGISDPKGAAVAMARLIASRL